MIKIVIFIFLAAFPLFPEDFFNLLPGPVMVFENSEIPPSVGLSLKKIGENSDKAVSFDSFEFRVFYNWEKQKYIFDLTWPSFWRFLALGFSLDYNEEGITPWFYGELDLFYFPFAFATIVMFEKPAVIPSAYLALKVGPEGQRMDAGIRVSFPLYKRRDEL